MRCNICDRTLSEAEIQYIPETKKFDCCSTCLEIAMDAAYCDGFVKEESTDVELAEQGFGTGEVELLDSDTYISFVDSHEFAGFQGHYDGYD